MKIFAIFSASLLFLGCSNVAKTEEQNKPQIIGGNRDAHGCLAPAGYQWSITRNSCVRVWEVGERLYRVAIGNSNTDIIITNNDGPIELFLTGEARPIILNKSQEAWVDASGNYKISKADLGVWELRDKNNIIISKSKLPEY